MPGLRNEVVAGMPGTISEIQRKSGVPATTVKAWVKVIHEANECHVEKWCKIRGVWVASYALGPSVEGEAVNPSIADNKSSARPPNAKEVVLSLLPGGLLSIREKCELSAESIRGALKALHKDKEVHVFDWERHPGNYSAMPLYKRGSGSDAPCTLVTMSRSETQSRYDEKRRLGAPPLEIRLYPNRETVKSALPGRVDTISQSTGLKTPTVRRWLRDIHESKESHIRQWDRVGKNNWLPLYAQGPGVDALCEYHGVAGSTDRTGLASYLAPPSTVQLVMDALPGSVCSIASAVKLQADTVRKVLRKLRADQKAHISGWERHPGNHSKVAIYTQGSGVDAACHLGTKKQDRVLRYKEKLGENGIPAAERAARNREMVKTALPGRLETITHSTGLTAQTVKRWLDDIHKKRESHVGEWVRAGKSSWSPWYVAGKGKDASCDFLVPLNRQGELTYKKLPPTAKIVLDALPGSVCSVATNVLFKADTVRVALRKLHAKKKIHISGWEQHPGNNSKLPIYTRGKGVDAVCHLKTLEAHERYSRKRAAILEARPRKITSRDRVFSALPGRREDVMKETKLSNTAARHWLNDLHENKEIHISSWTQSVSGAWVPKYSPGRGDDAACDFLVPKSRKGDLTYSAPPGTEKMILDALPGTTVTVFGQLPLSDHTVRANLRKMHGEGKVHVEDWVRSINNLILPVYAAGSGCDAVCEISPLTKDEMNKRKREARKLKRKKPDVRSTRSKVFDALPGRVDTVISKTGLSSASVRRWIKDIHEANESHISGWKKMLSGVWVARYSPGPGEDVKCDFLVPKNAKKAISYGEPPSAEQMVLDSLPGSSLTVIDRLTISGSTVRFHLNRLHKSGKIRICRWEYHKTLAIKMPVYSVGTGRDAICRLKDLTAQEIRERKKESKRLQIEEAEAEKRKKYSAAMDPDGWDTYAMRKEAIKCADEARKKGDPFIMALFGKRPKQTTSSANC